MATKHDYAGLVATERAAFADLIAGLGEDDKRKQSLCAGWSTRDVACHVASGNRTGLGRTLVGIVMSGFSPDRFNAREVQAWRGRGDAEIVEAIAEPRLKGILKLSPAGALTEIFLHQQDVRRPTGRARAYSPACLAAALDATVTVTTGTGSKKRVKGLALRATDIDWSHGSGAEVSGSAEALILAANGRAVAAGDLSGAGLESLRQRLAPATG
jgi:uncharacterized protein (TIGR03083 family)